MNKSGRANKCRRVLAWMLVIVALLVGVVAWYVNDCYHADSAALAAMVDSNGTEDGVAVCDLSDKTVAFVPNDPVAGFVFYPGAKVEPTAYAPMLTEFAKKGILCVLIKPLFNIPLLDVDAAAGVQAQFPQVERWMIGGHSLGGIAAASYLVDNESSFFGLVLLASYMNDDLTGFVGETLSVVGTNDRVLNRDDFGKSQDKLPKASHTVKIEGGNHAYFGDYGEQAGDGAATISRQEQQRQTTAAILSLVGKQGTS